MHSGGAGCGRPKKRDGDDPDEMDEETAANVWKRLEAARARHETDANDNRFYIFLPGGLWTEEHLGVANDKVNRLARSHVKHWCDVYVWPLRKGFAYTLYGEEESNNLAREWHSRSHNFYMLWCEAGSDYAYRFTQDDFDSYIPSEEWFDWGYVSRYWE